MGKEKGIFHLEEELHLHKNYIFASDFDGNFLSINNKNGEILWNVFLGSDYNSVYTTARPISCKK